MNPSPILSKFSPASLAFIGDAVYSLLVREALVKSADVKLFALHENSVSLVNAAAQAKAAMLILPVLTAEEADIYRRGRNAHVTVPKTSSSADYHSATGLEALFGFLYLSGRQNRLTELFSLIISEGFGNTIPI